MRGKKAKTLRRVAERATQGLPARRLLMNRNTGQAVNDPQSTRGVYRNFKKIVRRQQIEKPFTDQQ